MKRGTKRKIITLIAALIVIYSYFFSSSPSSSTLPTTTLVPTTAILGAKQGVYVVTKVTDGDTIIVVKDGKEEKVRLIGINTPETVDPRKPIECFGKEASAKLKELVLGKEVRLVNDETQADKDKYARSLRYIYLTDETFINMQMIIDGYAYEYTYDSPYVYQAEFKKVQEQAKVAQKGLWNPQQCL